jgi:integrase
VPDSVTVAERRQKIRAMTPEQLDAFLQAAAGDRQAALWLFLADTGVRPGEAFALRWEDVDLVAHQVRIERAAERGGRIKSTKTGSARAVDLTPRLVAALDTRQTALEAEALAKGRDVTPLVFPSEADTPLDDVNVAKRFRAIVQRAGLPRFRVYDLRHTAASHLLMSGAPLTYVANQLGHARPSTTLQHYAHWLPRGDHGLAERLEVWRSAAVRRPQGTPQGIPGFLGDSATQRET